MLEQKRKQRQTRGKRYEVPSLDPQKEGETLNMITFTDEEEAEFQELKKEMDDLVDEIEYQSRTINNLAVDYVEEVMDKVLMSESEEEVSIDPRKLITLLNEIIDRNMLLYESNERIMEIFDT